jgi:hypothetical protein
LRTIAINIDEDKWIRIEVTNGNPQSDWSPIASDTVSNVPLTQSHIFRGEDPGTSGVGFAEELYVPPDYMVTANSDNVVAISRNSISLDEWGSAQANINLGSNNIVNLGPPVLDGDAVNKAYADAIAAGLQFKAACDLITIENMPTMAAVSGTQGQSEYIIPLTEFENAVDQGGTYPYTGVEVGDRVLVVGQSTGLNGLATDTADPNNGIWEVIAVTPATDVTLRRAEDADGTPEGEIRQGTSVFVVHGQLGNGNWTLITNDDIFVGVTPVKWSYLSSVANLNAGAGLIKVGNTLYVEYTNGGGLRFNPALGTNGVSNSATLEIEPLDVAGAGLKVGSGLVDIDVDVDALIGNGLQNDNETFKVNPSEFAGDGLSGDTDNMSIDPTLAGSALTYTAGVIDLGGQMTGPVEIVANSNDFEIRLADNLKLSGVITTLESNNTFTDDKSGIILDSDGDNVFYDYRVIPSAGTDGTDGIVHFPWGRGLQYASDEYRQNFVDTSLVDVGWVEDYVEANHTEAGDGLYKVGNVMNVNLDPIGGLEFVYDYGTNGTAGGGIGIADGAIKDYHIDFGNSTNQINAEDIPTFNHPWLTPGAISGGSIQNVLESIDSALASNEGEPDGPDGSIQYNNNGAFGGTNSWFYNDQVNAVTLGSLAGVEGANTLRVGTNIEASGDNSIATGESNVLTGAGSIVTGLANTVSGDYSIGSGTNSIASGIASSVSGVNNEASGNYSHAEGSGVIASGVASHAEGERTTASQNGAHAEGQDTVADQDAAHAEGFNTFANATGAHSGGATVSIANEPITAAGLASFNHSLNSAAQSANQGALAQASAILGGQDHHIPSNANNTVIIGGSAIEAEDAVTDMVYVPNLRIVNAPQDKIGYDLLSYDPLTGDVVKTSQTDVAQNTEWYVEKFNPYIDVASTSGASHVIKDGVGSDFRLTYDPVGILEFSINGVSENRGDSYDIVDIDNANAVVPEGDEDAGHGILWDNTKFYLESDDSLEVRYLRILNTGTNGTSGI